MSYNVLDYKYKVIQTDFNLHKKYFVLTNTKFSFSIVYKSYTMSRDSNELIFRVSPISIHLLELISSYYYRITIYMNFC